MNYYWFNMHKTLQKQKKNILKKKQQSIMHKTKSYKRKVKRML